MGRRFISASSACHPIFFAAAAMFEAECKIKSDHNIPTNRGNKSSTVDTNDTGTKHILATSASSSERSNTKATPRVCGEWCSSRSEHSTPCQMDKSIIPCKGQYCKTTCDLWDRFVLGPNDRARRVTCEEYKAGLAYPRGAVLCDKSCLIKEVSPERYPLPTGLGVMCRPNTCSPGACPDYIPNKRAKALGTLECPCNWFGSECDNDWVPVREVRHTSKHGHIQATTIFVDKLKDWEEIIKDYRPGSVIRLAYRDSQSIPRDMAVALVKPTTPGELQILTSPPDSSLKYEVRQIAEKLHKKSISGHLNEGELYVNPCISGFFNQSWTYLMDFLEENDDIEHLVVLSTGAGLGGALSAVEAVLARNNKMKEKEKKARQIRVHLYYGSRDIKHIPMVDTLKELNSRDDFDLTVLVSGNETESDKCCNEEFVLSSVEKGEFIKTLEPPLHLKRTFPAQGKSMYLQHAVALDIAPDGLLHKAGATLENTAFVICGRTEILDIFPRIIGDVCKKTGTVHGTNNCDKLQKKRVFTNV